MLRHRHTPPSKQHSSHPGFVPTKANQKTLHQQLQQQAKLSLFSVDLNSECTRDCQTSRIATVFELSDDIEAVWSGAQLGVEVIRQGTRQGKPYVFDAPAFAKTFVHATQPLNDY